ncbi:alpha/beta hydrolase [Flaviaesturariibacter amylovorans]
MRFLLLLLLLWPGLRLSAQDSTRVRPYVLGEVHRLRSAALGEERVLNIYLPEGYGAGDTTRYAVLYLLDGSADEDFLHITGLTHYLSFPWLKLMPPTIVVGIANVDRRRDFTYPTTVVKDKHDYPSTGGSSAFIRFLGDELQPYIAARFRTGTRRALLGQSLGGLLAAEVLLTRPALFTDYLIVSPSFWWDRGSLLARPRPASGAPRNVYLAVGKEEPEMVRGVHRFLAKLKAAPRKGEQIRFEYFPKENHATILHRAAYEGLQVLGR